jgi:hypothetical protein
MTRLFPIVKAAAVLVAVAAFVFPAAGQAHHSFSMFDATRTVTLKGVVKEFQWTNPHVVIWVYANPASGPAELWSVELTSPGNLTRQGWSRQSLKPGDKVSVDINPLRDGEHGGGFKQLIVTDTGQTFSGGKAG